MTMPGINSQFSAAFILVIESVLLTNKMPTDPRRMRHQANIDTQRGCSTKWVSFLPPANIDTCKYWKILTWGIVTNIDQDHPVPILMPPVPWCSTSLAPWGLSFSPSGCFWWDSLRDSVSFCSRVQNHAGTAIIDAKPGQFLRRGGLESCWNYTMTMFEQFEVEMNRIF